MERWDLLRMEGLIPKRPSKPTKDLKNPLFCRRTSTSESTKETPIVRTATQNVGPESGTKKTIGRKPVIQKKTSEKKSVLRVRTTEMTAAFREVPRTSAARVTFRNSPPTSAKGVRLLIASPAARMRKK